MKIVRAKAQTLHMKMLSKKQQDHAKTKIKR